MPNACARAACALAALVWSSNVAAQAPERSAQPEGRYEVSIEGAEALRELLERHLALTARRGELAGQPERMRFVIERTPAEAQGLLEAEGYFDATVAVSPAGEPIERIDIQVNLGEPTRVRAVDLRFVGRISEPGEQSPPTMVSATERWTLDVGSRFRQEDWEGAKRAVLRELLSNRFPAARITRAQATIDAPARAADLAVEVDSGPEFRFGRLEVSGLQRYPPSVVENLNTIRAGTLYSQRALAELQTRLYTVPYFAGVNVVVEPQAAVDPAALPIKVEITEAARRKIDLGGGYSTDTGLRVQGSYTDINLFERGWRWRSLARIETLEQRAESALTLPLRPDGWQDEYTVLFNRSNVRDFEVQSYSVNYKHAKTEGRIERGFTLLATVSREFPEGANVNLKQALVPGYTWRYRVFDDVLDPRRGYEIGWQVGGGAKALLSDQNFLRTFGRAVGILPLTPVDNVVLRLEGGVVFAPSRDGIPAALLFRAGGDQSLRGYKYQSIGVTEGQAIVGGRYLVLGGAEYVRWLAPKWGAAVFIEAGDAFDERTALKLKRGYGVGARWRSPVGPINFDIAYGEAANSLRVHFSIGFVF